MRRRQQTLRSGDERAQRSLPFQYIPRQLSSFATSQRGMWTILLLIIVAERSRPFWLTLPSRVKFQQSVRYHAENLVTAGPPHPHKGAEDQQGRLGYIHSATYVKLHPIAFNSSTVCSTPFGQGEEGPRGIEGIRKIQVAPSLPNNSSARVLCIVYTHSNRHHVLKSIVETYGARCDGFIAASNKTDKSLGAVNILHAGPEAYGNMWQKVRSIWGYVHDHYRNSFEWYHIGGDNMFVIAENLRLACTQAASRHKDKPVYMGGAMIRHPYKNKIYCGGGSGYTLNRAALDVLVQQKLSTCLPHHVKSDEDRIISHCMLPETKCHHSVDKFDESRYHPLSPEYHASWKLRQRAPWFPRELKKRHRITATMKEQLEGISKTSVSFHLVPLSTNFTRTSDDAGMKRLHAIVHGMCDQK